MVIKVVVAVIFDELQRVLITRRGWDTTHGGFWEFPGGKLELNEAPVVGLLREIHEELGIEVLSSEYLGSIQHDYDERSVELLVYRVPSFAGVPICRESQLDLRWVPLDELNQYQFQLPY